MSIFYNESSKMFTLETDNSTYQMYIGAYGFLLHLYYGKKIENADLRYLLKSMDRGFSGNPYDAGSDRTFSTDTMPQEYSSFGTGDYRESCIKVINTIGSSAVDLRYASHRIFLGKLKLEGLPAVSAGKDESQTLEITLEDSCNSLEVVLQYSVLDKLDVITRSVRIINKGVQVIQLEKALSCCLDFNTKRDFDFITFYGRHTFERAVERTQTRHGKIRVDSIRGASSHQQNPFVILCDKAANETQGECFGFSLVYSGNFIAQAEVDQICQTRFVMGIHPESFSWNLEGGGSFQAPEVILVFSSTGLENLSHKYHDLFRGHVCRSKFMNQPRPILINNWEATYFDFDDQKLLAIAKDAAQTGIEMLVLDDGWFGKRDHDDSGLGDWVVNTDKIKCGLNEYCRQVNAIGLKFGIWFEPEMVSEDSNLYREHPDWCLQVPGRRGVRSRFQFVLDLSRPEVVEYLYQSVSLILKSANIEYVKWDMNRHLSDVWSGGLSKDKQGEVWHRYVLGLYSLLERLTTEYPNILFESCSGGGGRFDAGMLYYTPQIWCSDNTDAIDRISIQYGTSFSYPVSAVGSHVSAVPNHQTRRITPLNTRGIVAMSGTFGFELNICNMLSEEKEEIRKQIETFKEYRKIIHYGNYYRLTNPFQNHDYASWMFVQKDRSEALLCFVLLTSRSNPPVINLRLRGLDNKRNYKVGEKVYSGESLMNAGFVMPFMTDDFTAVQYHVVAVD